MQVVFFYYFSELTFNTLNFKGKFKKTDIGNCLNGLLNDIP